MAWVRAVCGRMKSDYRYSSSIVYNNFPWPAVADDKYRGAIETAATEVLSARSMYAEASLSELYEPLTMPVELVKAHQLLDRAVDAAYIAAERAEGRKPPKLDTDVERVAYLLERYQALTTLLPQEKAKSSLKVRSKAVPS